MRYLFMLLYYTVGQMFPPLPFPSSKLGQKFRAACLKMVLSECGKELIPKHGCYIGNGEDLIIGHRSQLSQNGRIGKKVKIGDDVLMAQEVHIITNAHGFENPDIPINQQGEIPAKWVTIEDDVWIGAKAIILPGVRIGKGAVVGAGSIVTKDVEPYMIVGGNPARNIRRRGSRSNFKNTTV